MPQGHEYDSDQKIKDFNSFRTLLGDWRNSIFWPTFPLETTKSHVFRTLLKGWSEYESKGCISIVLGTGYWFAIANLIFLLFEFGILTMLCHSTIVSNSL